MKILKMSRAEKRILGEIRGKFEEILGKIFEKFLRIREKILGK